MACALLLPVPAAAADPFPGSTRSHYLTGTGGAALGRAGARDAHAAARAGVLDALVILGAGEPVDGGHVRLPGSGRRASYADVRRAVVAFARGWTRVQGAPPLTLVVMAAAHGSLVGRDAGSKWGSLVTAAGRMLPSVDVRGGLDVEVEWATAADVRAWLSGYRATTARPFVDVGACTCPPFARLPTSWSPADLVAVATAGAGAVVVPQIYATAGGNATEWAALARWASRHRLPAVHFAGVLTEQAACAGPPARACAGIDLDPVSAWRQLSDRTGQPLRWASDIGYLEAPGPVHRALLRPALLALGTLALAGAIATLAALAWRSRRGQHSRGSRGGRRGGRSRARRRRRR